MLPSRPSAFLTDHHREIESVCHVLRSYACGDDPLALITAYRRFETELTAHFDAEEELLLPAYARAFPAISRMIRAEHESLRRRMMQMAIDVELHCIRLEEIDCLFDALRAHAELEDITLYRWVDAQLSAESLGEVAARLERKTTTRPATIEHTGYSR